MRIFVRLAFMCVSLLVLNGCVTQQMIAKAQGVPGPLDSPGTPPSPPQPAYYALVPLVLPIDLIAGPIELIAMANREPGGTVTRMPDGYAQNPDGSFYQTSGPAQAPYRPAPGSAVGYDPNPSGPTGPYYQRPGN